MRILWVSNGPWCGTGYASQTKHILRTIRDAGYPVAALCFWGLEGGIIEWEGIPCFPRQLEPYGNDAIAYCIRKFKADVVFTLIDLWVMSQDIGKHGARWIPLFPVDHATIPDAVKDRFAHAWKLAVYSRHAEGLVREAGFECVYLPHMVDCQQFRPASDEERAAWRKQFYPDWPDDAFIVGMVAANKGWPCRKGFLEAMEAFAQFATEHPEARLYLHSFPDAAFQGPPLAQMARHFGIADKVRLMHPTMHLGGGYDDEAMRRLYCTFDVFLNPAYGEGFCLPLVEAQSCGVPAIATDFSAMSEVVGSGWLVKPERESPTLLWAKMAVPDIAGLTQALREAWREARDPHRRAMAREFALGYDVKRVVADYWLPFLASIDHGQRELALELGHDQRELAGIGG